MNIINIKYNKLITRPKKNNRITKNDYKRPYFISFSSAAVATAFTEGNSPNTLIVSDSKTNLKEATGIPTTTSSTLGPPSLNVGNHLDIPQNNPNLLSPDVLSQRRG